MEAIVKPFSHYADFSGRARRREFWSFFLLVMIAMLGMMYLDTVLGLGGTATGYATGNSVGFSMSGGWLTGFFLLAVLVPMVAVAARRLHDVGKSAWYLLFVVVLLFGWIYLLYLYVQPGMAGPNEYGPDPKAAETSRVFT